MIPIRYSRVKKFGRKNKSRTVFFKNLFVCYLLLLIAAFSCSGTNALFTDTVSSGAEFSAQWSSQDKPWDKSSITVTGEGGNCKEIYVIVENHSKSDMQEPLRYEIYYHQQGDPKKGTMMFSGSVSSIKSGEKVKITFDKLIGSGSYMFKVYQSTNHPGQGEAWSGEVNVSGCKS